jgi:hypothetical protein
MIAGAFGWTTVAELISRSVGDPRRGVQVFPSPSCLRGTVGVNGKQNPTVFHAAFIRLGLVFRCAHADQSPCEPAYRASNSHLRECCHAIRRKTAQGPYEAVNYHRFADDIVNTVSGHRTKRGWAERALSKLLLASALVWPQQDSGAPTQSAPLFGATFGRLRYCSGSRLGGALL